MQFLIRASVKPEPAHLPAFEDKRSFTSLRTWPGVLRSKPLVIGLVLVGLPALAAVAAPLIAHTNPVQQALAHALAGPTLSAPMGTDELGRDELSRVLYGGRVSLGVSFIAVTISLALGTFLGLTAGFLGGAVDAIVMRLMDALLAFPAILLAIAITSSLGPGIKQAMAAIGIVGVPGFARVARAQTLSLAHMDYVVAARALGVRDGRIIARYILPNALGAIIALAATRAAGALFATAALSFVGLGAQPPTPDWGSMLQDGYPYLERAWWLSVFPGVAIALVTLGFVHLGDGLRDVLDPRQQRVSSS